MLFGREMYGTEAGSKDGLNRPPLFCPNPANWTPRFTYSFVTTLKGICPFGLRSSKLTSVAVTGGGMSCAPALPTSAVSSRALAIRTVLIRSPQFPDVVQRWTSDLVAGAAAHRDDSPGL